MKLVAVYTTVGTLVQARKIASTLVERRLVACAQISAVESHYFWEGALQNDREFRILLKTTEARYKSVEAAILALHDYELPAIHAVAVEHAHAPYEAWVGQNSIGETPTRTAGAQAAPPRRRAAPKRTAAETSTASKGKRR